ncbi:MAG TPA: DedA family protein [Pyrinomonadaceae bacterium]|jgi:membrane protein DedA with SNARE-associated domain
MTNWIMNLIGSMGYFGIVFLMFVENVFPPIPSEFIMPLAGFMVTQNKFSLVGIIIAGTLGSVLGALPLYYLGKKLGEERIKNFADRHGKWLTLSREDIDKSQKWFDRHGAGAVFFCRLVPGIRSFISIPAGINRMNMLSFLFFTVLGSAIWTSILAYAGYFLGSNFREVENYLDVVTYVVFGAIIALYLWRIFKSGKKKESEIADEQA